MDFEILTLDVTPTDESHYSLIQQSFQYIYKVGQK